MAKGSRTSGPTGGNPRARLAVSSSVLLVLLACAPHPVPPAPLAPTAAAETAPPPAPLPEPVITEGLPPHWVFPAGRDALPVVLASNPRILGVGELHASEGGPAAVVALAWFREALLPTLAPHTTDLVIETWRVGERCGEVEEAVAETVQEETQRVESTPSDLVLLVKAADAAGVRPHDLAFTCAEYEGLLAADQAVQFGTLMELLTVKLQAYALAAVDVPDATMVLYGGAVHNDVAPRRELVAYSYGVAARDRAGLDYVELDLYPPELVKGAMVEPAWAPLLGVVGPDRVVLHERAPGSFVLLLPTVR